jgi:uncharacterized membrane protein/mono/diheme cytochrome c family protein
MLKRRMSICVAVVVCAAAIGAWGQAPSSTSAPASAAVSAPGPTAKEDLAPAFLGIVEVKCTQCHGPQVAKPPKGFGYVTDLRKLVEGGKVVPGKPEESLLYKMVSSGMMPKMGAKNGGVTNEQIEVIRAWIAAGAPAVSGVAAAGATAAPAPLGPSAGATAFERFAWQVGKYHLQLVHFPIALLLAGVLAELLNRYRPAPERRWCARFCLWLGALGAVATAATGWLLDSSSTWTDQQEELVDTHGWLGTSAAAMAVTMVILGWVLLRKPGKAAAWIYVVGVVGTGVLVSLAGHWGGMVAWGQDLFGW